MSDAAATDTQKPNPNKDVRTGRFVRGHKQNGNPGGMPKAKREVRKDIDAVARENSRIR
jgi:hypothetical protein